MGLFSKEECCFCHNKVGALSRTKIKSGEFICSECHRKGNAFVHLSSLTRDQIADLFEEAERGEARFQETKFNLRKTSRVQYSKTWTFYDNFQTGEFFLETPETETYKNHFVYRMDQVFPFGKADQFLAGGPGGTFDAEKKRIYNMIKVEQRKDKEGKTERYTLKIPYNYENMVIEIKFPGSMAESDVRLFQSTLQAVIGSYNTDKRLTPTQLQEIQKAGVSLGDDSAITSTSDAISSFITSKL